jgi:hypothetical protein
MFIRTNEFENYGSSISYAEHKVTNGLLFFGNNKLIREEIDMDPCLTGVELYDKDIGSFGVCKYGVNNTYICTNAPNNIVTLDLNDGVFPGVASSTYVTTKICYNNCAVCDVLSKVCQTPAANTYNYE